MSLRGGLTRSTTRHGPTFLNVLYAPCIGSYEKVMRLNIGPIQNGRAPTGNGIGNAQHDGFSLWCSAVHDGTRTTWLRRARLSVFAIQGTGAALLYACIHDPSADSSSVVVNGTEVCAPGVGGCYWYSGLQGYGEVMIPNCAVLVPTPKRLWFAKGSR